MSTCSEAEAVKITSDSATERMRSGIRRSSALTSGNSAARASARGKLRLTMSTSLHSAKLG